MMKARVLAEMIDYERNKEMLEKNAHIKLLDMAMIFRIEIDFGNDRCSSFVVPKIFMKFHGLSEQDLYNETLLDECKVKYGGYDYLTDRILHDAIYEVPDAKRFLIVTNEEQRYGACLLTNNCLLRHIYNEFGTGFYILPSSKHDFICISDEYLSEEDDYVMKEMVHDVNSTVVSESNVLTDSVYYYSESTGLIKKGAE